MEKIKLGVMFGGASTEHEISVISALQAIEHIDKEKYEVIPIYLSKDNTFYYGKELIKIENYKNLNNISKISTEVIFTKKDHDFVLIKNKFPYSIVSKVDIVLPVMHGYNTEDGCIAGFLEVLGIPYCESDIYASVIAQDKIIQKAVLKESGVNVVPYYAFLDNDFINDEKNVIENIEKLKYPVIVKPSRQGSSVGISVAKDKKELIKAINEAIEYDEKILVEKVIENLTELNASVLGDNEKYTVSAIEEVYGSKDILSYQDKYMSGGKKVPSKGMASAGRKVPADIAKSVQNQIEDFSIKAAKALNTCGVARIDYLLDNKTKKVYLNEVNITPGSLSFYLWTPKHMEYKELLNEIIALGIKRYQKKNKKLSSFETSVLESFKGTKGVKK